MKVCKMCGKEKSLIEYYKHPKTTDGHLGKCKECAKIDTSSNYRNNIQHYHEYEAERRNNETRILDRRKSSKKYSSQNINKRRAQGELYRGVSRGVVTKQKICSHCNAVSERPQAHHPDYSKPLEVMWLCGPCHRGLHHGAIW